MKKKVVVLGVNLPEHQVVMETALASHKVKFVASLPEAIAASRGADILAIHADHEIHVPAFHQGGFSGTIVPLLRGNKKTMKINGKLVDAVSIRGLPDKVLEIFGRQRQVEATAT